MVERHWCDHNLKEFAGIQAFLVITWAAVNTTASEIIYWNHFEKSIDEQIRRDFQTVFRLKWLEPIKNQLLAPKKLFNNFD